MADPRLQIPDVPAPELRFRRQLTVRSVVSELWRAREMVRALAERSIRSRYKQTFFGFAWALIMPLTLMVVFTVFFRRVADVETGDVPYALFSYVALVPWGFFTTSISQGGQSLTTNMSLLNKVPCPREVFPLSAMAVAAVDAAIAVGVLGLLFGLFTFAPAATSVWVPVVLAVQVLFTAGVTFLLSSLTVYIRDLRQLMPLIVQFGLFATPIAYELEKIPDAALPYYAVANPLGPVIDAYRRTILEGEPPQWTIFGLAAASSVVIFVVGYAVFKRLEPGIADVA